MAAIVARLFKRTSNIMADCSQRSLQPVQRLRAIMGNTRYRSLRIYLTVCLRHKEESVRLNEGVAKETRFF